MVKAGTIETSGEALVVKFADAFPLTVVAAAKRRLDDAPRARQREDCAMLIEAGYDIAFECPAQTPMLLQLSVHPSRDADLLSRDVIASDPPLAVRSYIDHFGNRVTRVEVPAGLVTFSSRFVIHDSGRTR